jgi:hypothetical protein
MVTGLRQLDGDGDGRPDQIVLRYETRQGAFNPVIHYLRYCLAGSSFERLGDLPPRAAVPECVGMSGV